MLATTERRTDRNRDPAGFAAHAGSVMTEVRASLVRVIESIPGPEPIQRAAQLERALGLRKTLAWQMFSVAHSAHPITDVLKVPGRDARLKFFHAAASSGVPPASIRAAEVAFEAFERLIADHSGDRESFVSMASGVAEEHDPQVDLQHKRAAFRANSHFLGRQVRTCLNCSILRAVGNDCVDVATISGLIDARRLRPTARLVGFHSRFQPQPSASNAPPGPKVIREPIERSERGTPGIGLLRDFCSDPLPELNRTVIDEVNAFSEFNAPGIGRLSEVTCFAGSVMRNLPSPYTEEHPVFEKIETVRVPLESLVLDVMIQQGFFRAHTPTIRVCSDLYEPKYSVHDPEAQVLPTQEQVMYIGSGTQMLHTPDVPRYSEMVQYALEQLGWENDDFDVYRCRIRFPILPSTVQLRFDLSERVT